MSADVGKTPLYEEHVALGAHMVSCKGWEMPLEYMSIVEEHNATRSHAGVFDMCDRTEFRVFGFGSFDFLQGQLTNDLAAISELGTGQHTLLCDEDGGIIDDLLVYHSGDIEYLLIGNAQNRRADWDRLTSYCPEDVEIADESSRTGLISLQGPLALDIVSELAADGFTPPDPLVLAEAVLGSVPVLLSRTGSTGEDGVEILCFADHAPTVWRAILSFPDVTPCGLGARETLRLESGYRLHGTDMDRGVDPISAGLGWAVSETKTDFVGSEAIGRIRDAGPGSRLVGIVAETGIPRPGHAILHGDRPVGKVASGTYSPTLRKGIATAYLPVELAGEGQDLGIEIRRNTVRGQVTRMPFAGTTSRMD
jgi:aminomethyltransferase